MDSPLDEMPSETIQNLPYFIYMKTQNSFFHFPFHATLFFSLMNVQVFVNIDQGSKFHEFENFYLV